MLSVIAAALFFVTGCGNKDTFTINGKLTGANKDSLILEEMTEKSLEFRASIVTGEDGSFQYSDTATNPRLFFIRTNQNEYITLMVLGGETVTLTGEKGRMNESIKVTGSPQTELVMELNREVLRASNKLDSLGKQYQELKGRGNDPQVDSWVQGEYEKLIGQQRSFVRSFIQRHPDQPASLLALSHQIGREPVLQGTEDFDLFIQVDAELYKKYPRSILIRNLHNYVAAMQPQMEAAQSKSKTSGSGAVAPDISLPDPEGNIQSLSSLRGKIVLLDFWAGWCGPCRRENPVLVKAYAKYHDKGFEIFQVSLDKTRESWTAAIKQDGLNWIHVSDLKFWSSPAAKLYGVESIPANFLLDKEGKIIGSNLRGEALEAELAKLFR